MKGNQAILKVFLLPFLLTLVQPAMAITTHFLPIDVSLATLEATHSSYDSYFVSGTETESAMGVLKGRNKIETDAVSGAIAYQTTTARLHYRYGLMASLNLGISIPYVVSSRSTSVTYADSSSNGFVDSVSSADSAGVGDIEISAFYRLVHSDVADLQLGMAFNGDNGSYYGDEVDKMPLGSGSNEISLMLKLLLYSIHSRLTLSLELEYEMAAEASVKSADGGSVTKTKENEASAILDIGSESGAIGYGGGVSVQSAGATKLDGVSQKNGYLGFDIRAYLTVGNLYLLESRVVNHPWEITILGDKRITGDNAPNLQTISVEISTYF